MPPALAVPTPARPRAVPDATTRGWETTMWGRALLTLPFLLIVYVQLAHHAMWRDELNAFGIAAGSGSLGELLHNVRYEGHPWLWYTLLWLVSKVTHAPAAMKVLQGAIATAILLVIGFASPFRWWQKLLLFLNYYVLFEYTVMSRMYGLVLLFALLYLRERVRVPRRWMLCALWLGLMASADATGVLLSVAFAAELAWTAVMRERSSRRGLLPLVLYASLVGLAVVSMMLPKDRSVQDSGILFGARPVLLVSGAVDNFVVVTYLPTMTETPGRFWGANANHRRRPFTLLAPLVLLAYWMCFRRRSNLLVLLGTALLLLISLGALVYSGSPRHFGIAFVAFLGCLWLQCSEGEAPRWPAYVLLGALGLAGIHATVASWRRPFSYATAAGKWIQANVPKDVPLIGTPDSNTIGVAEEAERPLYMLECQCSMTFLRFQAARNGYTLDQLPARMELATRRLHVDRAVLVWDHVASAQELEALRAVGLGLTWLKTYPGAEAPGEDFVLYSVQRAAPLAPAAVSGAAARAGGGL